MLTLSELRYIEPGLPADHTTIGIPLGTRLHRIVRLPRGWRVWTATTDFVFGTYLELHDSGRVYQCTARRDEGEDVFTVRPSDDEIRRKLHNV